MNSSTEKNDCVTCEFQDNLALIRQIPFFSELPLDAVKLVAYLAQRETFKEGDTIFAQGDDDGQAIYFITGRCRLIREGCGADREDVDVGEYGPGGFLGGFSLLGPMPRVFTLVAAERVECVTLERERFQKAMEPFPHVLPALLKAVIKGVRSWEESFCADPANMCRHCRSKIGVSLL